MKTSAQVTVAFLSSCAAAVVNGCGDDGGDWVEAKRCVNNNNVVVEESWCEDPARSSGRTGGGFHSYYYGGRGYYPGEVTSGGGRVPQGGVKYQDVSRGGSISS